MNQKVLMVIIRLDSVADFSVTEAEASTLSEGTLYLLPEEGFSFDARVKGESW